MHHDPGSWLLGFNPKHCWHYSRWKLLPLWSPVVLNGFCVVCRYLCLRHLSSTFFFTPTDNYKATLVYLALFIFVLYQTNPRFPMSWVQPKQFRVHVRRVLHVQCNSVVLVCLFTMKWWWGKLKNNFTHIWSPNANNFPNLKGKRNCYDLDKTQVKLFTIFMSIPFDNDYLAINIMGDKYTHNHRFWHCSSNWLSIENFAQWTL